VETKSLFLEESGANFLQRGVKSSLVRERQTWRCIKSYTYDSEGRGASDRLGGAAKERDSTEFASRVPGDSRKGGERIGGSGSLSNRVRFVPRSVRGGEKPLGGAREIGGANTSPLEESCGPSIVISRGCQEVRYDEYRR